MSQKPNFTMFIPWVLVCGLVLTSCSGTPSLVSNPIATSFPTQSPIVTSSPVPSATSAIVATSTLNTFLSITLDELFSFSKLPVLSTPGSADFCENLPAPQISSNSNEFSILSGRFLLCPSISRPWVDSAIDLDTGTLVSVDNENADFVMEYAHVPIDGTISYYVMGLNSGHIDEIKTNALSYAYCENVLAPLMDRNASGILNVHDGAIACVTTTKGQIAAIRVEKIYPLDTQTVEFSFAILRE